MSAQEFKPGDRVRCVRSSATSSNPAVTAGDEYVIAVRDGDMVSVDGMPSYWWSTVRFEKVEPVTEPSVDNSDDTTEPEPLKEGGAVRALAQAIIWTREYVGEATLPAMKGWSWYDALREYAPEFLPEEPTQCTSLYEYEEGKYVRCCRASGHANPDHQGYGKGWLAESARLAQDGAS